MFPIGPSGPGGPAGPRGPANPVFPCGPGSPVSPAGPGGPKLPGGPRLPCGPTGPKMHTSQFAVVNVLLSNDFYLLSVHLQATSWFNSKDEINRIWSVSVKTFNNMFSHYDTTMRTQSMLAN